MPEKTTNLNLPIPLGNENVNRQYFVDLIQAIDSGAVSEEQLAEQVKRLTEGKQDMLRLADNYLAASVLVNAAPDAQGRAYPDGVSMFKVSNAAAGWPAANGYVLTMRAGSGGYQIFYELYTGAVQTDKTARQWTRSKRDSNAFWQDWARVATEVDLALKMDANRPSNLLPNGGATMGFSGWRQVNTSGVAAWVYGADTGPFSGVFRFSGTAAGAFRYLESDLIPVAGTAQYTASVYFNNPGTGTGYSYIELVDQLGNVLGSVASTADAGLHRKYVTVILGSGVTGLRVRLGVSSSTTSGDKFFSQAALHYGANLQSWNNDVDSRLLFQLSNDTKTKVRSAIIGQGGTVADADGDGIPTGDELAAGVNRIIRSRAGRVRVEQSTYLGTVAGTELVIATFPGGLQSHIVSFAYRHINGEGSFSLSYDPTQTDLRISDNTTTITIAHPYSTSQNGSLISVALNFATGLATAVYDQNGKADTVISSLNKNNTLKLSFVRKQAGNGNSTYCYASADIFYG
ncbi:hypothetical protein CDO73_00545 [Saccharibacillus sp. O23]|uniref:hypothetical protein n=1 Tax=Saccharibacillus sp. O23 TaxID=2009338 RepID=UPI000B4E6772|nr:hypothetical protein [Saccharibacillus sp. O23]OWR33031.1 hypothetical protein CDO73_00545 [Saccharibacillus sp. O23]